jgi:hypothetical protein
MKKSILFFLVLTTIAAKAQGNLQFNQVINLTAGNNYIVPQGKVLKIESISMSSGSICIPRTSTGQGWCLTSQGNVLYTFGIYNSISFMQIGDLVFNSGGATGQVTGNCPPNPNPDCWTIPISDLSPIFKTPIWLREGKSIQIYQGDVPILISAIEFNVINN